MTDIRQWQDHSGPLIDSAKGFDVIECEPCGFKHIVPIPTPEELDAVYRFEHLNYFSPQSMTNMLKQAGFEMDSQIALTLVDDQYPKMTCVVHSEKMRTQAQSMVSDFETARQVCDNYLRMDAAQWRRMDAFLDEQLSGVKSVVIWGAGIHTSQLLARTNLGKYGTIDFIVDSDPQKWGSTLAGYVVKSPDDIRFDDRDLSIVISSYASEAEIYKAIVANLGADATAKIVRLYAEERSH